MRALLALADHRPMTYAASSRFRPPPCSQPLFAPRVLHPHDVSVVIPVRDNQGGIDRVLRTIDALELSARPREIVVVDDGSDGAVVVEHPIASRLNVRIVRIPKRGPAAARNEGWRTARGCWVLFIDSDCVPSETFITGFVAVMNGSVAYAGNVQALAQDELSRYYDMQHILVPPPTDAYEPAYLVTANALVWRQALVRVGGFDESFPLAGGEDIDLALRLARIGRLSYGLSSVVFHDYGDGLVDFVERFIRYGRGNRLLEERHGRSRRPEPFVPARVSLTNCVCAAIQYGAMLTGYEMGSE